MIQIYYMKKVFAKFFIVLILLQGCDSASVPVKKSKTNICHEKGSRYYDITKYFKAYQSKIVLKVAVDCPKDSKS